MSLPRERRVTEKRVLVSNGESRFDSDEGNQTTTSMEDSEHTSLDTGSECRPGPLSCKVAV